MQEQADLTLYLAKADESLAGAESEYANGRYNNCANRSYYACFHAAIAALSSGGIHPGGPRGQWGHDFVQAEFVGQLINRRRFFAATLREVLARNQALRQDADYGRVSVTERQTWRALQRARAFVQAIRGQGAKIL